MGGGRGSFRLVRAFAGRVRGGTKRYRAGTTYTRNGREYTRVPTGVGRSTIAVLTRGRSRSANRNTAVATRRRKPSLLQAA